MGFLEQHDVLGAFIEQQASKTLWRLRNLRQHIRRQKHPIKLHFAAQQ
jgi:hypothetical protein